MLGGGVDAATLVAALGAGPPPPECSWGRRAAAPAVGHAICDDRGKSVKGSVKDGFQKNFLVKLIWSLSNMSKKHMHLRPLLARVNPLTLTTRLHGRTHVVMPKSTLGAASLPSVLDQLVEQGVLRPDSAQRDLCAALENMRLALHSHRLATEGYAMELQQWRAVCARLAADAAAEEVGRATPAWRKALHWMRAAISFGGPRDTDARRAAGGPPAGASVPPAEDSEQAGPAVQAPYRKLRFAQARAHADRDPAATVRIEPPPPPEASFERMEQHQVNAHVKKKDRT